MSVNVYKAEILCQLEQAINSGRRIFLFDSQNVDLLELLSNGLKIRNIENVEIWHCVEKASGGGYTKCILKQQMEEVLDMYRMYDFSDHISVISDTMQYGSLFNYVKTGIITMEEMVDALLYMI